MEKHWENIYEIHTLGEVPVIFHHDVACHSKRANWHENIEILLFTKGNGVVVCEEQRTPVMAGDICVVDSNLLHRVESEDTVFYDCLIVDDDFCQKNGLFPGAASFQRCIRCPELTDQYNKVAAAFESNDPYRAAEIRAAALTLMVTLMRHFSRPSRPPGKDSSSAIRTAIAYIRAHFADTLDLDRLAAEVNLSKYHFIRKFKEATGQTVVAYINAVRIEQAERLLREGELSVAAVADACGFVSHSYFSKVFYRLRGVLPSELQEKTSIDRRLIKPFS